MVLAQSELTPQPSPHEESLNNEESLKDDTLNKQNSIFSLTLEEIQCKSGKCFGSMNMDEFLASVWSVEENQVSSQSIQTEPSNDKNIDMQQPTLTRQGSFSIPIPLCKKTVDEVWFDIQKDQPENQKSNNISDHEPPQRQQTFGEMTLEDFLIKAGVVQEAPSPSEQNIVTQPPPVQNNNTCLDANYGMGHAVMRLPFHSHQNMSNNLAGNGYAAYSIFPQSRTFVGESSNTAESEKGIDPGGQKNKKRIIDGPPEVVVERRQRRMIKNRESAARSRARKQAYTVELELELNQLREENAKLKQLVEEIEEKRKQELLMKRNQLTTEQKKAEKLRTTRRTVSCTW